MTAKSGGNMKAYSCQECGYLGTPGQEFHSYESCILYLLKTNPGRINDKHRRYVWKAGIQAMEDRVEANQLPEFSHA